MILHNFLHFLVPAVIVGIFFRREWKKAYSIMAATMLVDIDHLLATPVYDPGRCSIGFHPLHGLVPIGLYLLLCFIPKLRYAGIGLVVHMGLDSLYCRISNGIWTVGF